MIDIQNDHGHNGRLNPLFLRTSHPDLSGDAERAEMNIIVLSPVRLLGDGLAACLSGRPDLCVLAVVNELAALRESLATTDADLVLIDVTQGIDLFDVRAIATEWPDVSLVALGLNEQRDEVIRCG